MEQPKVSIIVPVHNAGKYLEKCLTSIVNQTLKEIEIILVLDCPTDGSNNIAEGFAAQDKRIVLIYNSENLHTGISRNKGIEAAKGKYIGFFDHDDYCEPDMYELLYQKAEEERLDVVRCNFLCVYKVKSEYVEEGYKYPDNSTNATDKEWFYENVCSDKISCVIWNHLYKADFLKQNALSFLDSRNICSEDSIFFINVYDKIDKIGLVPDFLYYHVFHSNNTGKVYAYRSIKNRISFFEELYKFLKSKGISESKCNAFLSKNVVRSFYSASRQAILLFPLRKAFGEINALRKNNLIMSQFRFLYKKENLSALLEMKPTIVIFSFLIKFGTRK
ncbi:glycosyltransferase [Dysgonomonas sp. Marseille-Q5470]|uniref:glycosyltransferase n=1 Tax=Dysgonomonas sp. Marseille-Q5470 TaxID=3039494 RepID=UPI0024BBFAA4|nr:glycosyltransferase [Dysgonomonas sp. Marseille-Q5470]